MSVTIPSWSGLESVSTAKLDRTTVNLAAAFLRRGNHPDQVAAFLARHVRIREADHA